MKKIKANKFYPLFQQLVNELEPDTRINAIDSTPLRSSKCDSEAQKGYSTRLGWYKGYKLHLISSNDYIPLKLLQKLDERIENIKSSKDFKKMFEFFSRFHQYSFRNQALIEMQKPDATYVAGYKQ